jgi:hypothetical protein
MMDVFSNENELPIWLWQITIGHVLNQPNFYDKE